MDEATEIGMAGDAAKLIAQIERDRGIDLSQYRLAYVERRLATRLRALGLVTYRQYAAYLTQHPDEHARLLDALTVNVTDFYRDPPVWKIIRTQVVPAIIAGKGSNGQRAIRVWSAGCATGEEPYSLAMMFLSTLGTDSHSFLFSVTATDLDPLALRTAQRAEYDATHLDQIPPGDRFRFAVPDGKTFKIKPEVTEHVRFRELNLFKDDPPLAMDLIMCRNVFIYFTREQQERVVNVFHRALSRGGYLVLGRTEKMPAGCAAGFEAVSAKERIYRKI